jgi:hypothetical protein
MKTKEQHRQDVVNYLRLTAQHKFLRGKQDLLTIIETEDGSFFEVNNGTPAKMPINIDWYVDNYMGDAKNVIKNRIFYQGHGYTSIRRKYYEKLLAAK